MTQGASDSEKNRLPQLDWGSLVFRSICFVVIISVVAIVFSKTRFYDALQWDDQLHLTANPFIQPDSPDRFLHFWREPYGKLYIPITYNLWAIVYARCFDSSTGTFAPRLLHLLNVVTHALNACLVFLLLRRLLRGPGSANRGLELSALSGAILFAVHPLQAESVAWIAEFRGLVAATFGIGAWIIHLSASNVQKRSMSIALELLATACFAAALLCKPSVAALPMMVAVADWLLMRQTSRQIIARLAGWFVLAVACLIGMKFLQAGGNSDAQRMFLRPLIAIDSIVFYLAKLVWPFDLGADYSRTPAFVLASSAIWWTWIIVAWICLLLVWKPNRFAIASAALFVLALLPVLGLVAFEFQFISSVADRYAYLALIGPALGAGAWLARRPRWAAIAMMLAVLLGWRCVDQLRHWRDDQSLWAHAAAVNPRAAVANANLGDQAARAGDRVRAKELFDRVIEIAPGKTTGYLGNGRLREEAGDVDGALKWYERASEIDAASAEPLELEGQALLKLGRGAEAEVKLRQAIELNPDAVNAWVNLSAMLLEQGKLDESQQAVDRALQMDPRHMEAWVNHAALRLKRDDLKGYLASMNRAAKVAGADPTPLRLLGAFAMRRQEWLAARECYERVLRLKPNDLDAMNNLGQALAVSGEPDRAIMVFEQALQLAPDSPVLLNNLASARKLRTKTQNEKTPSN